MSDVLRGLNWVVSQYRSSSNKRAVIKYAGVLTLSSLSLGSPYSRATNQAVSNAVSAGITVVVAAGNGDDNGVAQNACDFSPSSSSVVVTVGASDQTDQVGSFSNYGRCVTLIAPGVRITSLGNGGETQLQPGQSVTGFGTASGTSFAAPIVAGVVALMMGEGGYISPGEVKDRLMSAGTKGVLRNVGPETPNLLVNAAEVSLGPGTSAASGLEVRMWVMTVLVMASMWLAA